MNYLSVEDRARKFRSYEINCHADLDAVRFSKN